jgi:CRISPR-associated protein Cas5d
LLKKIKVIKTKINDLENLVYLVIDDRAQRHTLGLRNVAYIIKADVQLKSHANANPAKYRDQFRRRVKRGQCHHQPYLGTREFSAFFGVPESEDKPIDRTDELGLMLLDVDFTNDSAGSTMEYFSHDETGGKVTKGKAQPKFFRARLENGVLRVPES